VRLVLFVVAVIALGLVGIRHSVDPGWIGVCVALAVMYGLGYWTASRQSHFRASAAAMAVAKASAIAAARARSEARATATQNVVINVPGYGLSERNIETLGEAVEDGSTDAAEDLDGVEVEALVMDAQHDQAQ